MIRDTKFIKFNNMCWSSLELLRGKYCLVLCCVVVLVAEVIHHQLAESKVAQLVEKHNYQSANSSENKKANWELLRQ